MTTPAIHHEHHTTPEGVLFVALELSEKTWQRGCTTKHSRKTRERTFAMCNQESAPQGAAQAHNALVCRQAHQRSVVMQSVVKITSGITFYRPTGSPTMCWMPPLLRAIVASNA